MTRDDRARKPPAEQITELLTELEDEVRTEESVVRYRPVHRGRRTVLTPDFVIHRTRMPGLIAQARAAAVPQGSPGWDADGALSPMPSAGSFESQEPVTEAFHLPEEYANALLDLAAELREHGHTSFVAAALADEDLGYRIVARLRAVVSHARIVLHYDAPVVPLRDVYCPECGGSMHVRADASSAVWCAGAWVVEGPARDGESWPVRVRCGATWPRGSWVKLLAEATAEERIGA
jgi:hypothetical protein